ncbi:MAG TPA: lytic transglycosylase domain-containing protein [Chitinophagaceae bacterium]|nr:lytic transglycosylase domain-containing protein [Chitinophagaceae bacterium]
MQKSTLATGGRPAYRFIRYPAGIAALVLAILSLMSFKYANDAPGRHNTKKDSAANTKNFEGLLSGDYYDETVTDRSIFTLPPDIASFVLKFNKRENEEYGNMRDWGKPYFTLYDSILSANGVPAELKYLSVIESNLQSVNTSGSNAVGPWQLMSYEAKRFGLKTKGGYDERMSYGKSTEVAAKLLKELHETFGDWLLTVAAYNCGIGRMKHAIAQAHSKDYWKLQQYLPAETRYHVKKYIATHYFFEGGGGWTTITAAQAAKCRAAIAKASEQRSREYLNSTATAPVSGGYKSTAIIRSLAIDAILFNELNPAFDKTLAEGKTYSLKLPQNKMPLFITNRKQILEQSAELLLVESSPAKAGEGS